MTQRLRVRVIFGLIIIITGLSALVAWPKGPDINIGNYKKELKVHLGLDLQGGIHLVYQADVAEIPESNRADALEGARDVIERRVNLFGVTEPVVQTSQSGDDWRVIVELAGVFDISKAIETIGDTPLLEFRESPTEADSQLSQDIEQYNIEAQKRADEALVRALEENADFGALANELSEDPGNTDPDGNKLGGELGFATQGTFVEEFDDTLFNKLEDGKVYNEIVETVFGYHIIKRTNSQNFATGVNQWSNILSTG